MSDDAGTRDSLVISYLGLRRAIGVIGTALPFALALGDLVLERACLQPSMSDYYYTAMGDVLVGSLCAIGIFLFSYQYDRRDNIAGNLACAFAAGVAFFPTTPETDPSQLQLCVGKVHYVSATALFLTLAYFSLILFRKTDPKKSMSREKKQRNIVYTVNGYIIISCIVLIGIYYWMFRETGIREFRPVFWLEALAVEAFGISWLIKGETILKDRPGAVEPAPAASGGE